MQQLRDAISTHKPVFVVIDSLTSSNRTATVEEKDVEYGRCLYDLRDIAMELGVAILVLHHENKTGGVRGSTAIKANVSEVWHLVRDKQLAPTQRLLDIEKSRSGCSGLFQLQLDVDDYSWQHQGEFDPANVGTDAAERPRTLGCAELDVSGGPRGENVPVASGLYWYAQCKTPVPFPSSRLYSPKKSLFLDLADNGDLG